MGRAYGAGWSQGFKAGRDPLSFDSQTYDAGFKEGFKKGKSSAPFEFDDVWKEAYDQGFAQGKGVGVDIGISMVNFKPVLRERPSPSSDEFPSSSSTENNEAEPMHENPTGEPLFKKLKSSEG